MTSRRRRQSTAPEPQPPASASAPGRRRIALWAARLATLVLAPALFLVALEGVLRVAGYGHPSSYFVPARQQGILEPNPRFGWRFFGADLNRLPTPQLVPARKPDGVYRIVVLGASAARGEPNPAFSFGRVLETMLAAAYPGARFEVINTGMTAINSHVVLPIARECVDLDPDLYVIYLGNNEVVGPYGAGSVIKGFLGSRRAIRASLWLRGTRVGQLLAEAGRALRRPASGRRDWGGMQMFLSRTVAADDPRLERVYENFDANLRDICDAAAAADVPVVLSTVLTNLADQPPLASLHRADLSDADLVRWQDLVDEGRKLEAADDTTAALARFRSAETVDDRYAELSYLEGRALLTLGRIEEATAALTRARDLDALRFRADTRINAIIREVAQDEATDGVQLLDAAEQIRYPGPPPEPVPGRELLYEHVHLTFAGNYLVAAALYREIQPLLPARIRGGRPASAPIDPGECGRRLLYTPYDQCADAEKIARITGRPPFPPEQGRRDRERADQLESRLTNPLLDNLEKAYLAALRSRPGDLLIRSDYADLLFSRRKTEPAAAQWRELLDRYPDSSDWATSLGDALRELGRNDRAVDAYRNALRVNPARVDALDGMAVSLERLGHVDAAERALTKALRIRPTDPGANVEMGRFVLRGGDPVRARGFFLQAIASQPDTPVFYRDLGVALAGDRGTLVPPLDLPNLRASDLMELLSGLTRSQVTADWNSLAAVGVSAGKRVDLVLHDAFADHAFLAAETALGDGVVYRRTSSGAVFEAASTSTNPGDEEQHR